MVEWYLWLAVAVVLLLFVWRWVVPVLNHPAHKLGRQASKMGWVADGVMLDNDGYRNLAVKKNGMKAVIQFSGQKVILVQPKTGTPFNDFVELESWLQREATRKFTVPPPPTARPPVPPPVPRFPEPRVVPEEQRDYHPVLDEMTDECVGFIIENELHTTDDWRTEVHAEAVVYLACYNAKLGFGRPFSQGGWNTFKSSVENRMLSIKRVASPGEGVKTPGKLVSYVSGYHPYLTQREKLARPAKEQSFDLADELLGDMGGDEGKRDRWRDYFSKLVARGSKDVLPKAWLSFEV